MTNVVDLTALRLAREAARREANQEGPVVVIDGARCELAAEMPYEVLEALRDLSDDEAAAGALANLTRGLLGEHFEAFRASKPTLEDVKALIEGVMSQYGVNAPLD
jgi:hypothetical protein